MDEAFVVVVVVAALATVAFTAWYFSPERQAMRALRGVPVTRIADVVDGATTRIVGDVRLVGEVEAPLSGRRCAYWRVVVQERRQSGKSSSWQTVIDDHGGVDFLLEDGSGRALVRAVHVKPLLEKDAHFSSGFMNDAAPRLEAFLSSRGRSSEGWVFNKTMRYREGVVEAAETVAVVGACRWERDPDESARAGDGYREAAQPKRLVVGPPAEGPLLLSDEVEAVG